MEQYLIAALLGIVEGLTEFLPVSSTGHLILFGDMLGMRERLGPSFDVFIVMIQLGAVLAVVVHFWRRIWETIVGLPSDPKARRFAGLVLAAFLPAIVLGGLFGSTITELLFSPAVVGTTLIIGGILILIIEALCKSPRYHSVDDVPLKTGLGIGFCQALAMIPGTSRSGATIMGGMLLGLDRQLAAEFSFFLAMPTMAAAFAYDAYKSRDLLDWGDAGVIAVGFVAAFFAALLVVRPFLAIVGRIGFAPFAYYRVALGTLVLVLLFL